MNIELQLELVKAALEEAMSACEKLLGNQRVSDEELLIILRCIDSIHALDTREIVAIWQRSGPPRMEYWEEDFADL